MVKSGQAHTPRLGRNCRLRPAHNSIDRAHHAHATAQSTPRRVATNYYAGFATPPCTNSPFAELEFAKPRSVHNSDRRPTPWRIEILVLASIGDANCYKETPSLAFQPGSSPADGGNSH
jgi:hypothetical protein